jgi:hypothetical protein
MKKQALKRKVLVTERALVQRVNRALSKDDECLKKSRPGSRMEMEYGMFYSVDLRTNNIVRSWKDIESVGRELDLLKQYEALAR